MYFTNTSQTRRIPCEIMTCCTIYVFQKHTLKHYALPAKSSWVPFVIAMSFKNCSQTLSIACKIISYATIVGNVFRKRLSDTMYCLRNHLVFHFGSQCFLSTALRHYCWKTSTSETETNITRAKHKDVHVRLSVCS